MTEHRKECVICEKPLDKKGVVCSLCISRAMDRLAVEGSEAVKKGTAVHEALEIWVLVLPEHDPRIWKGTSNKHRNIARLPEGKTGIEALKDVAPGAYRDIVRRVEQQAADTYRRMYAEREGNQRTLTPEEWAAFKAAGGESSW